MRIFTSLAALVLVLAGCSGSSSPTPGRSFGAPGCVPGQPVGKILTDGTPACAELEDSGANTSGGFDCAANAAGKHYYVVSYEAMTVYGPAGGTWRKARAGSNVTLIKQLVCHL